MGDGAREVIGDVWSVTQGIVRRREKHFGMLLIAQDIESA